MRVKTYRVLAVDDDPDDLALLCHAFTTVTSRHGHIHALGDGNAAISYMVGEGAYADRTRYPFPNLLITDLKMPQVDGFDLLEFMQINPAWSVVPRIVLTSSDDDDDVRTAYLLGASAFHRKPRGHESFEDCVRGIVRYWMSCEMPPVDESGRLLLTDSLAKLGARYRPPAGGEKMRRVK